MGQEYVPGISGAPASIPMHEPYVKICTPVYSDVADSHKLSLMDTEKAGINFEYQLCRSVFPGMARNMLVNLGKSTLVKQKIEGPYTHYLFVDADIHWHPSAIEKLLKVDVPIISGSYISRQSSKNYQAGKWAHLEGNPGPLVDIQSNGVSEIDWVGAGFLLCKKEVFERMEFPWFRHMLIEYEEELDNGAVLKHAIETNEDCGFCVNARKAGYKIYIDCDTVVFHDTEFEIPMLQTTRPARHFEVNTTPTHNTRI